MPGGPRYDPSQTEAVRHSAENGLWLCENCASLIDKDDGRAFPASELAAWKVASERAMLEEAYNYSGKVLESCINTLIYINIPRIEHYIELTAQDEMLPPYFKDGIPGSGYIAPQLSELRKTIARLKFGALPWDSLPSQLNDPTGMLVSFQGLFRTKNGPSNPQDRGTRDFSNLKTAPHIYQKVGSKRLVLPYDPKFMTTSTACVEFNAGQVRVGGFAQVKVVDGHDFIASPLFIGLYSSPETRAFWDAFNRSSNNGQT
jgi:hypothetical protein